MRWWTAGARPSSTSRPGSATPATTISGRGAGITARVALGSTPISATGRTPSALLRRVGVQLVVRQDRASGGTDDSARIADRIRSVGGQVELEVFESTKILFTRLRVAI